MSIHQLNLLGKDKIEVAIMRLQEFEPPEGYYLSFSGGKDSIVIKELAKMANVKYEGVMNLTTIDPPDLIWFVKKYHPDIKIDHPQIPFLKRLETKGFPLRQRRWCCEEYKERGGEGRFVVTGVRWAESPKRRTRMMIERCTKRRSKHFLHVIIDWSNEEVWEFIREKQLPYCNLYDLGWKRIGCLFCPFQDNSTKKRGVERYPKYVELFRISFNRFYQNKKIAGQHAVDRWENGDKMFEWWLYNIPRENDLPLFS
jgi:phosphoadenosine phosphosulfate reductase